jgi:hypothetical protein
METPSATMPRVFDSMLRMAQRGIPVFFIPPKTKAAASHGWQDLATTDQRKLQLYAASQDFEANQGLVAKAEIGGFLILDDDHGVLTDYEDETGDTAPRKTLTQQSIKGFHYIFSHTQHSIEAHRAYDKAYLKLTGDNGGELCSLRMHNAYVVGAGSQVPIAKDGPLAEYKVINDASILAIPDRLLDYLTRRYDAQKPAQAKKKVSGKVSAKMEAAAAPTAAGFGSEHGGMTVASIPKYWRDELSDTNRNPIMEGSRDDYLTYLAGGARRFYKLDEPQLYQRLTKVNVNRCVPPLDDESVKKIARSIGSKPLDELVTVRPEFLDTSDLRGIVSLLVFGTKDEKAASGYDLAFNVKAAANQASDYIYRHLLTRGKIFNGEGVGYLLLEGQEDKPIKIARGDARFMRVIDEYGIKPGQDEFIKVGENIEMMARTEGKPAIVRYSSFYDTKEEAFYFAESKTLIRGDGLTLQRVSNGYNGKLFIFQNQDVPVGIDIDKLHEKTLEIDSALNPDIDSLLWEYLFCDLKFERSHLDAEAKRILLTSYIMLIVLSGIVADKPNLQLIGPSGCGKTFFLKKIGKAIVGPKFTVQSLPEEPKEFENVLINTDLAFFDNTDHVDSKIRKLICLAATGFSVVRRELFTTTGEVRAESKATIGFSALTSILPTAEQANRSMVFQLRKRGTGNMDENDLLAVFDINREAVVTEILARAQRVLCAFKDQRSFRPKVSIRLAGIATLILRVARFESWESKAWRIIEQWDKEQTEASLEDDDLSSCIINWLKNPHRETKPLSGDELATALRRDNPSAGDTPWKGRGRILGKLLKQSEEPYRRLFGLSIARDSHTKSNKFTFNPDVNWLTELRAKGAEREEDDMDDVIDLGSPAPASAQAPPPPASHSAGIKPGDFPDVLPTLSLKDEQWVGTIADDKIRSFIRQWAQIALAGGDCGNSRPTELVVQFIRREVNISTWSDLRINHWVDGFTKLQRLYEDASAQRERDIREGRNVMGKEPTAFETYRRGLETAAGVQVIRNRGGAEAVLSALLTSRPEL